MDFPAIPNYTSKSAYAWFRDRSWNILEWPVKSPDLILIENIWLNLKKAVAMWKPKIISDLKAFSGEEWATIAVERW